MTSEPFASVVVPTRNRPEFVRECLQSLRNQTFDDFEVILVDNHTGRPARGVFDELAGPRFRYLTPDRPLPMYENWELGVGEARGEYVLVVIDKTILLPSALEAVHRITRREPVDVVTWRDESYNVIPGDAFQVYTPSGFGVQAPAPYDPHDELRRKLSFAVSRSDEGLRYYRGKICFGAYRRGLVERMRAATGRVFHACTPDYTSMTAALVLAESALDLGLPLTISATTDISNGARCAQYPGALRQFMLETDPSAKAVDDLPVAGLYASPHNLVGHDYLTMRRRLGERMAGLDLDLGHLLVRILEDLHVMQWDDPAEKRDQYAIWRRAFETRPAAERVQILGGYARFLAGARAGHSLKELFKARLPRTARFAKDVLRRGRELVGREKPPEMRCASIHDAARSADATYRPVAC